MAIRFEMLMDPVVAEIFADVGGPLHKESKMHMYIVGEAVEARCVDI